MNRRYFLGLMSAMGAAFVASRCGVGPNGEEPAQFGSGEFYSTYGQYGVYGTYGQYGEYGQYGPYGGSYGPYGGMYGFWDGIRALFIKPAPRHDERSKRALAMFERLTDRRA